MRIREADVNDAAAIARVHVDSWRTTYTGILPDEHLARLSYDGRERVWRDILNKSESGEFVYIVEDGKREVVGFASGGPERSGDSLYRGELYAVYLLKDFQRRGAGRQLALASARKLLEAGQESMLVWVLAKNPSRGFYEALGGELLSVKPIKVGEAALLEVAYGWRDLKTLAG